MTIVLKRMRKGSPPVQVELAYKCSYSNKSYIRLKTDDGLHVEIGGHSTELAALFEHLARECRTRPVGQTEAGVIHAGTPEPEQEFNLITIDDIPTDNPALAWRLIAERFRHTLPDLVHEILSDKSIRQQMAQAAPETTAAPVDALAADLAAIESLAPEIVEEGKLVWGGQTRIAEALGIENTGGANRKRILAVVEALEGAERKAA